MVDFKEEVIFIIGEFGLEVHYFNHIKLLLVLLIVNLELKAFLFGKLLKISQMKTIEDTKENNSLPIKNTTADLVH